MNAPVMVRSALPLSLQNAPSLIERIWPAQKISVESQKERKANSGQTLTPLGTFWKGRKPLFLVRACILGALLPATGDDEADLALFEALAGISDEQIKLRYDATVSIEEIQKFGTCEEKNLLLQEIEGEIVQRRIGKLERQAIFCRLIGRMPYTQRVQKLLRPEQVSEDILTREAVTTANSRLGTSANSLQELVQQLGILRYGHSPRVADTFTGGGSVPFEAARLGCDVFASDLNPIACMLTWGALNIVGAENAARDKIEAEHSQVLTAVGDEVERLGIEKSADGNRAKAYLYCMEATCPQTGWAIPLAPTWVISKGKKVIAKLRPDHIKKRFDIEIISGASDKEVSNALTGTIQDGKIVYALDGEQYATSIKTLRGDNSPAGGQRSNNLRMWDKSDFKPREDDIFRERLYCIQWISIETVEGKRQKTYFRSPTSYDIEMEKKVDKIVKDNLASWQKDGFVPTSRIEPGEKTDEPIRTRGWTYWHHLFFPRALLVLSMFRRHSITPAQQVLFAKTLDYASRCCRWVNSSGVDAVVNTFDNQALNVQWNPGLRGFERLSQPFGSLGPSYPSKVQKTIASVNCSEIDRINDIYITDPPYADAVVYHEITEFFIAWLKNKPADEFSEWTWDSRRPLAIQGKGDNFRKSMTLAYARMGSCMPDNGIQIVMFTHQDAGVWADMVQIFWGAGLRVMAAWYIATETTSELKKGGYVQGTVILVLRKKEAGGETGFKDEVVQEVKTEVADQIDTMTGLNQALKGHGRVEYLFEDADLQMAGYAAALRVLTRYSIIDNIDMAKEALKPTSKMDRSLVGEIIDFAVQVANEHMVPEGMAPSVWERLTGAERFFYRMMDIETTGARKLDNYQNFAKAFRVPDYSLLMSSVEPTKAKLKAARQFKKSGFEGNEFAGSKSRALLYAIWQVERDIEGDKVLSDLRELVPDYLGTREDILSLLSFIALKRSGVDEPESRAAEILTGIIRHERL